jgi:hypothetical protein
VIEQVAADELGLAGLRARAWRAGAHADGLLLVEVDGTLVDAHSEKEGAAGTSRGGFGFSPLVCLLGRGNGTGEALAGILRPGNAGSNTAADHLEVIDLALAQCPAPRVTSRSWSAPTPAASPTPWSATCPSVVCGSGSACRPRARPRRGAGRR